MVSQEQYAMTAAVSRLEHRRKPRYKLARQAKGLRTNKVDPRAAWENIPPKKAVKDIDSLAHVATPMKTVIASKGSATKY